MYMFDLALKSMTTYHVRSVPITSPQEAGLEDLKMLQT
jgi:hypothetical protein